MTTKATKNAGGMAGKSNRKVASTTATEKALAKAPKATKAADPVKVATDLHHRLLQDMPKLDKVGVRLEKALKAIMDGGAHDNLPDLQKQVTDHIATGTPDFTKSTSRRRPIENPVEQAAIAEEAEARKGKITSVQNSTDGGYLVVSCGEEKFTLKKSLETPDMRDAAQVGKTYLLAKKLADDLRAKQPAGHLARGVDGHNSPQTTAAHAAKKQAERKAAKATEKPAPKPTEAKKEARKAERAEKAAPKAGDKRAITILKKDFAFGKEGTARRQSWDKALKAKTVDAYISAGGAAKYLPRWVSAGAVKLG